MNRLTCPFNEADWIGNMKKELVESLKDKEEYYNFDFVDENIKDGRFVWEPVDRPEKPVS